ncbi:hypothetical protein [Rhodococcus sp. NPDC060176]|uniref:hypothetical protein n=1 Tax=Rhodococcus sp. NPDC060176 TaxID=3347062 RepID=UPI00364F6632
MVGVLLGAGENRLASAASVSVNSGRCAPVSVRRTFASMIASAESHLYPEV